MTDNTELLQDDIANALGQMSDSEYRKWHALVPFANGEFFVSALREVANRTRSIGEIDALLSEIALEGSLVDPAEHDGNKALPNLSALWLSFAAMASYEGLTPIGNMAILWAINWHQVEMKPRHTAPLWCKQFNSYAEKLDSWGQKQDAVRARGIASFYANALAAGDEGPQVSELPRQERQLWETAWRNYRSL